MANIYDQFDVDETNPYDSFVNEEKTIAKEPQDQSLIDAYLDWQKKGALGFVSGAADIGNTLINASTFIPRKIASAAGNDAFENWNKEREASLRDFQKSQAGDTAYDIGRVAGNIAGTAGVGNVLKVPALAANMPRLAQALETGGFGALQSGKAVPNALLRLAAGGAVGGASAGMVNPEDADIGALVGAGTVAVGVPLAKGAAHGAGKLYDLFSGRLPSVTAGKIAREVAGDELDAIRAANSIAPDDITSAQATAGVPRFEWATLGERARSGDPTAYGLKFDKQEAARLQALDDVMPDLDAAIARRTAVTGPLYDKAMKSKKQVDTSPVVKLIDKYIRENKNLDPITNPLSGIRNDFYVGTPQVSSVPGATGKVTVTGGQSLDTNVRNLSSLSQNIKAKIEARNPDGTPQFDVKALTKIKEKLDEQIGAAEPKYAKARARFKTLSAPVNQARLIQEMKNTLVSSKGGERVTPFLNAMGTGEKSLFRRADQSPRFGSLDEVLTSKQRSVKDRIVAELRRDAEVERRARDASKNVAEIVQQDTLHSWMPQFVDKWFSAARRGMDVAGRGINKETMKIISDGMKTGKSANEMLAVLPTEQRNKVLKAIIEMNQGGAVTAAASASAAGE